jgi:hypothetical protein
MAEAADTPAVSTVVVDGDGELAVVVVFVLLDAGGAGDVVPPVPPVLLVLPALPEPPEPPALPELPGAVVLGPLGRPFPCANTEDGAASADRVTTRPITRGSARCVMSIVSVGAG